MITNFAYRRATGTFSMCVILATLTFIFAAPLRAQWEILASHTTASLRGIHALGNGVAWASGTEGTVLRTTDDGATWQPCAVPPAAEHLDFRGIQAFDAATAIVMSSGKGDLSRLYKTTDACRTWTLLFTNPDPDGFWDAIQFSRRRPGETETGVLVGDPVNRHRVVFLSKDQGQTWLKWNTGTYAGDTHCKEHEAKTPNGESLFAASNSSLFEWWGINFAFVTGGKGGGKLVYSDAFDLDGMLPCTVKLTTVDLPLVKAESGGGFSLFAKNQLSYFPIEAMVVGGDYMSPESSTGNAVFLSTTRGATLPGQSPFKATISTTPPHGYRSSVAYDAATKTWITVGPNGTDVSTDDGRNWRALKPSAADSPDADRDWNALSLPFVVGPHGRIGKLRSTAVPAVTP